MSRTNVVSLLAHPRARWAAPLAAGLVAENLGVLELKRVDVSLEDIFVELTTSEEGGT